MDIRQIGDVKTGIGADQLCVIEPPSAFGAAAGACALPCLYKVDGRRAEACGNVTRCFGSLMLEEAATDRVVLQTAVGALDCQHRERGNVRVQMGTISADWRKVSLAAPCDTHLLPMASRPLRDGVALNVGNPHAVFFVDDIDCGPVAGCLTGYPPARTASSVS